MLAPAAKVLPKLRQWFREARIVGWKYELAGSREEAFAKAYRQIAECATDACVLNGAAYGDGYALCRQNGGAAECEDANALASALWGLITDREPV